MAPREARRAAFIVRAAILHRRHHPADDGLGIPPLLNPHDTADAAHEAYIEMLVSLRKIMNARSKVYPEPGKQRPG